MVLASCSASGAVIGVVVAWVVDSVGCADGIWRSAKRFLSEDSTACRISEKVTFSDFNFLQFSWLLLVHHSEVIGNLKAYHVCHARVALRVHLEPLLLRSMPQEQAQCFGYLDIAALALTMATSLVFIVFWMCHWKLRKLNAGRVGEEIISGGATPTISSQMLHKEGQPLCYMTHIVSVRDERLYCCRISAKDSIGKI